MTKNASLILRLTTNEGFKSSATHNISLAQWREICSVLDDAPLVSRLLEAYRIILNIVRQLNAGGDEGKVFARDDCIRQAIEFVNGRGLPIPDMFWDGENEGATTPEDIMEVNAGDFRDVVEVYSAVSTGKRWLATECLTVDEHGEPDETVVRVCDEKIVADGLFERTYEAHLHNEKLAAWRDNAPNGGK